MILFFKLLFKNLYTFLVNKKYRQFFWLVLFESGSERRKQKKIKFLSKQMMVCDSLSFIYQFKEIFVDEYYYFNSTKTSPVIYDCGANIGMSCLYFKTLFPNAKIKAFEADPSIAEVLKSNMNSNGISDVELFPSAIWINNDHIEIAVEGSDAASIYMEGNKVKVTCIRLQELLSKEDEVDFLKIDIEGAETEVIKDCKDVLYKVKNIFIEYHSFPKYPQNLDEILGILSKNNFRYSIISPTNNSRPFVNIGSKGSPDMDLQLNIFAYKPQSSK